MKPLFKNITKYTKEKYDKFIKFHANKYGMSFIIFTILFLLLIIYCIILTLTEKQYIHSLIFILVFIGFLAYKIYLPIYRYKNAFKKNKQKNSNTFTFSFYKNYFKINDEKIYYFSLYRVFETEKYFYLYINKENSALVDKSGFKIGTSEEFSRFMKQKCRFKYR